MSPNGHRIEVTGLSPQTTDKDLYEFFAFSGAIDHVEIFRSGECACTAYVTFRNAYTQETATLLIWEQHESQPWNQEDEATTTVRKMTAK